MEQVNSNHILKLIDRKSIVISGIKRIRLINIHMLKVLAINLDL